jgi:hypothetical protein
MKTIQHTIGGEVKTLDFGKLWYSKFFGEATGIDPLSIGETFTNPAKQFDLIVGIVYGGINCNAKVNGGKTVTIEQVQDWVGNMEDKEAAELINKFAAAISPKETTEPGEVNQVESPSPGMS